MKRSIRLLSAITIAAAVIVLGGALGAAHTARAFDPTKAPEIQDRLLDGTADYELKPTGDARASHHLDNFTPRHGNGCGGSGPGGNVKVNQNCLNITDTALQGRGQAENETAIAINPQNQNQIVAAFNDYRRGDGNCYSSYSSDNGRSWTDSTPPMGFTDGTAEGAPREYWQGGGDPSMGWDTRGDAFYACQMFQRGDETTPNDDLSSGVFLFRSTGNGGASWNFPARPVIQSPDPEGTGTAAFIDKPYMAVDGHTASPFRDRIYVTWTTFEADGTAYLYSAHSSDYGESFSAPVLVSTGSSALCGQTYGLPTPNGGCNENQYSDPFTASDGTLYVAYSNFNNVVSGQDNRNQILLVKSTDGGQTFSAPTKVGDYYDLPECDTYQGAGADPGRACVPEKGPTTHSDFRATNYASGAADPANPSRVVVTYGSYINSFSKEANGCAPAGFAGDGINIYTGVKTAGACNNKILYSVSTDGGGHFTGGAATADPRTQTTVDSHGQAGTDQFFQWAAFGTNGRFAVSYYDRQYGDDETTGNLDVSLSGSSDLTRFGQNRVTTSSMPPPTEFSGQFFGDYSGMDASNEAHPLWMDTRNVDLFLCPGTGVAGSPPDNCTGTEVGGPQDGVTANDEDILTAGVQIPH
ncbi:MAG TPA: sialidase family protein [Gaiellaceae bacterium]